MTNEEHQLDEMVTALHQVINVSEVKATIQAKREVIAIIDSGLDNNNSFQVILTQVIDWANK
jgi:cell fate (sporulation/competence/biofilm development) regulator YlbF (YheA/YmcA/DUF963 family)